MTVNLDAQILSSKLLTYSKKFPVVIFSHGLSSNRNIHASLLKEWATHGFICFSLDHEEEIEVGQDWSMADMQAFRFDQIKQRKEEISKVIDFIFDQ
eukprot:CAMPEP_0114577570 /NCGR_PEP_ID=MMETSP0125-20121206/2221_1 /TAXON_ID=485358 ORGANISM="Aristerostoma sp., Strain ATCC 50986" /NCGR_SAMPLE_ID=MMETSP0125 /ASSEMBLY_ACC=CAM_ASM_000245 /LENGTH=96 /DNA_ID=CAMNT_0001766995 /DNA_START=397 /DNA_END=687 /DNA_ORIENTATION=+